MKLLRDYDRHGSEAAFAELVQRHIALVYSTALRHVGIAAQAQEITQVVFVILARKAATLHPDTVLEGWLYETTRLTALSFMRAERRRQFREQAAYMQSKLPESTGDTTWHQLAPLLDEGMARLGNKDRDAVVLRFFKKKNVREVAAALQVNEAAAQRRILRAVEKLRVFFTKRGIAVPAAILTAVISANSVQAAPVALAKSVTAVAIAKGLAASSSTLTLIEGALKIMAWTKAKTTIVISAVLLLAAGTTTTLVIRHQHQTRANNSSGTNQRNSIAAQVGVMRESVFPAVMFFAKEHQDEIPKSMADLKPYLSTNAAEMDDDHWQISATGKLTPLLTRGDVILLEPKNVPPGQKKFIIYADGHVERK